MSWNLETQADICALGLGEQKDFEVYSLHVSPDGTRLATAAGGKVSETHWRRNVADAGVADGYVRIWSVDAILQAQDPNYAKPKQLCHMSYHSGTIHTVRFSPNGRWLASGADDKIICIYHLDTNPPSHQATFGTHKIPGSVELVNLVTDRRNRNK